MMGGRGFDRGPGESDPEPGMDPGSDFEQELGPEADFGPDSEFGPGMNVDLILFLLGRGD